MKREHSVVNLQILLTVWVLLLLQVSSELFLLRPELLTPESVRAAAVLKRRM